MVYTEKKVKKEMEGETTAPFSLSSRVCFCSSPVQAQPRSTRHRPPPFTTSFFMPSFAFRSLSDYYELPLQLVFIFLLISTNLGFFIVRVTFNFIGLLSNLSYTILALILLLNRIYLRSNELH